MRLSIRIAPLVALAALSISELRAETIFSQDFENGLGRRESVRGTWSINDQHPVLNNDTMMMGHSESYGFAGQPVAATASEYFYAYYELIADLRGFEDVVLNFDFVGNIEQDFDGFNVQATTNPPIAPPDDLLEPTAGSELQYRPLTIHGQSSPELGPNAWSSNVEGVTYELAAEYDLSGFDDQKVTLRFQFGTDALWGGEGANFDNIVIEGTPMPDTDNDGMPDSWEEAYDLIVGENDSQADGDGDTLKNIEEFELCTDPRETDTDGDGFDDNVESNSGTYVSPEDPGTDPSRADTDGDGLDDGVETNTGNYIDENDTGSDPNVADSDGDGFLDGVDPDPTDDTIFPSVFFGGSPFTTTHVWNAGTMNTVADAEAATAEDNQAGQRITVETPFIHFHDNTGPPAFSSLSRPYPLWDEDNGGTGFGDRNDFAIRSVGQINIRPPGGLVTFVCNSDDGFSLRIDGTEVGTVGNRGRGDTIMEADLDAGIHELEFLHWERGGGAGVSVAAWREFGGGAPPFAAANEAGWELLTAFGAPQFFEITGVELGEGELVVTWSSTSGQSFVVEQSSTLLPDRWEELDDNVESGGESTSYTVPLSDPVPEELFVRIRGVE